MAEQEQTFEILSLYNKDISAEAFNTPEIFTRDWEPEISVNLGSGMREVDTEQGVYEVAVKVTVTAKLGEDNAYIVEVEQAGLFNILGMEDDQLDYMLKSMAPNILFPYARETVSTLIQKVGFQPILLAPINFDGLYQQQLQQEAEAAQGESSETKH